MKISKFISLAILPLCISCNLVSFERPMPEAGKTLDVFPKSLTGTYYSTELMLDSNTYNEKFYPDIYLKKDSVEVNSFQLFINEKDVRYTEIEKKYYDTTKINLNTIKVDSYKKDLIRETIGNHVLYKTMKSEKVADLSKDILKEKDGHYYLNIKNDEKDWICIQILREKKNILTIQMLSSDMIKNLPDDFTIKKTESGSTISNISQTQFNYLIKENYFEKLFSLKKEK